MYSMLSRSLLVCCARQSTQAPFLRQLASQAGKAGAKAKGNATATANEAKPSRPALLLERSRAPKTQTTYKKPFAPRKQYLFGEYDKQFGASAAVVVLQHHNLSGSDQLELRKQLKLEAQGAKLMVVRPKMFKAVLRNTRFANMETLFSGPTAIVYWDGPAASSGGNGGSDGAVDAIKGVSQVLNIVRPQRKLIVMGAKYGDSLVLNPAMARDFVRLPSIDQLRAQVVGVIESPASSLVSLLNRIPQRLVGVLKQRADGEGQAE
ncbi:hypothetical protein IWW48_000568 [Coemansia sp. RSA 1200]|nr:hypothetical protein IWW48_000568 [Coemansia sp. RSA 1200]